MSQPFKLMFPELSNWSGDQDCFDCLIAAPGFEDRTLALVRTLTKLPNRRAVLMRYRDWQSNNKVDELIAAFRQKKIHIRQQDVLDYYRYSPDGFADALSSWLTRERCTRVLLDISTMSKLAILLCLEVLRDLNLDVTLFYAEASDYGPSREEYLHARAENNYPRPSIQVSTGVAGVMRVTRLSSVALQGEPCAAIAFMSLNERLTQALINAIYPSRLFLVNGRPPVHTWREEATAWIHDQLRQEWPESDNPVSSNSETSLGLPCRVTSTLNYAETVELILGLYWELANQYRIILAPTGSKMQTLGCFIAKALHPDIHIEYPTPESFLPFYSVGIGPVWQVKLGRVGDYVQMLRLRERRNHLSVLHSPIEGLDRDAGNRKGCVFA
jgi:hypothetical protein